MYKVNETGAKYLYLSFIAEKDCVVVLRASRVQLAHKLALFLTLGPKKYSTKTN